MCLQKSSLSVGLLIIYYNRLLFNTQHTQINWCKSSFLFLSIEMDVFQSKNHRQYTNKEKYINNGKNSSIIFVFGYYFSCL